MALKIRTLGYIFGPYSIIMIHVFHTGKDNILILQNRYVFYDEFHNMERKPSHILHNLMPVLLTFFKLTLEERHLFSHAYASGDEIFPKQSCVAGPI